MTRVFRRLVRRVVVTMLAVILLTAAGGASCSPPPEPDFSPTVCTRPARPMGPVWTPGRSFSQFPAATFMYVLPVPTDLDAHERSWRDGWRVHDNPDTMHALTLVAMQGVINRETPCVYLEWSNPLTGEAAFWARLLSERLTVERVDVTGGDAIDFLYQRFAERFTGAVVYDPEVPDTINVAMMLGGIEDRMVLAPQQLGQPGIPELRRQPTCATWPPHRVGTRHPRAARGSTSRSTRSCGRGSTIA